MAHQHPLSRVLTAVLLSAFSLAALLAPDLHAGSVDAAEPRATPLAQRPAGAAAAQRTTADIMAAAAADAVPSVPRARTGAVKAPPNRRLLSSNPSRPAVPALHAVPKMAMADVPSLAPTIATPNTDVVTLADTSVVPPDTMGDVGPTQYLVGVNGRIRTIGKATGTADGVLDANIDTFFDSVRNAQITTDPRVRYDRRVGRWYVLIINLALPNRFLLAVSDTAVISGSTVWTFHFWANDRLGEGTSDACVSDYPSLGVDEDALYVGANQYCGPNLGAVSYDSSSGYVIPKAQLLAPTPPPTLSLATFHGLAQGASPGLYSPQGVDNFDDNTSVGYFIGVDNASLSRLQVRRVLDPGGTPTLEAGLLTLDVDTTEPPSPVPHPGGLASLDALDDRLQQAVIRNGRLWTNHQIQVDDTGAGSPTGDRNGIRWYEIENLASAPAVRQSGTVFDPAGTTPASYFMGSMMVSGQGHVALGSTVAGAATFVNAAVTGRLAGDPPGTMNGAPTQYTSNTSFIYNVEAPPEPQRWGENSYTSLDPTDDMTMWTLQQYVQADNSYALRLVRLLAPPPAQVVSLSPNVITNGRTSLVITVTGTSSAGSGFFDPGAAFPNRLVAAFSGSGVTVTGFTVASPTAAILTVDTTGAPVGARDITITNPDGQSSVLAGALTVEENQAPVAAADAYGTSFNTPLTIAAPGVLANDSDPNNDPLAATLVVGPSNGTLTFNADGSFTYTPAAGYSGLDSFTYQASDGLLTSSVATVGITVSANSPPVATPDTYATAFGTPLSVPAPGVLGNDTDANGDALTAVLVGGAAHGVLTLNANGSFTYAPNAGYAGPDSFTYQASDGLTTSAIATVALTVNQPSNVQAPTGLFAYSVAGNVVTLRWTPPAVGPAATNYVLEGGINPAEVLASIPTNSAYPIYTFVAPTGSFHVRMHAIAGSDRSAASNEIRLHVNVPVAPSAPASLVGLVNGSTVSLAWRNTFEGGTPSSLLLDVTGAAVTTIPLGATDHFSFAGVPAGSYTLRLRAANAAGSSSQSSALTLAFPGPCTGAPEPPIGFLAYKVGNTIFVVWDPAPSGAAPTGYAVNVSGAFVGSFPTAGHALSSAAAPGAYHVSVVATNACGSSAATAVQTVNIP